MKLIYEGKTKNVYDNENGTLTLKLKDDATGKDGIFDPGENAVGLRIEGFGRESLRLSAYYFELLTTAGIPNHYLSSNIAEAIMDVKAVKMFGQGVEFICRRKAAGSFIKRYGTYTKLGADLNYIVEITLKDDERNDPFITKDTLTTLGIMTAEEYETCVQLTKKTAQLIAANLEKKELELYDLKFEFGKNDDEIMLADEISAGCMRVYKNGEIVAPMDLGKLILQ
ncbi:MAG: phosphoribosylaminoimidazolesuccinocarboxamide synthase [Defluviitaleaceae bacterium]|nr:phosphoribosylaminoimidazolesuccinocarboxamide synthase [Defluviitaleaceae bacterium]